METKTNLVTEYCLAKTSEEVIEILGGLSNRERKNFISDLEEAELKLEKLSDAKICVICGKIYPEWGNNALPIKKGQCCDECNKLVVAERMSRLKIN